MTDEKMQTLKDDIAFMRALAQEGSSAPLLFGGNLVAAGLIFGSAAVGHWLLFFFGLAQTSPWLLMVNWLGAGAIFAVACTWLVQRAKGRPGFGAGVNKATGAAWSGIGFAIFAMWMGLTAIGLSTGHWQVMNAFPVLIFALYGAAWFVAGALSGLRWIKLVAMASFAAAVGMGALSGTPWLMLGYCAALLLLAVVPGWILMRQEPTDIV